MPSKRRQYRVIDVQEIVALAQREDGSRADHREATILPEVEVAIPRVSYGQMRQPDNVVSQWPDEYNTESYRSGPMVQFDLENAIVHGEQGIITVGAFVVRQSLYHVYLPTTGFVECGDGVFELNEPEPSIEVADAHYAMCGLVANHNYAHWWIDVASILQMPPFGQDQRNATLLMPKLRRPFQLGTLELLPEARSRAIFLSENVRVQCRRLAYIPNLVTSDPSPHPARRALLDEVRRRVGAETPTRRIYVSRQDATKRRLENEAEVIALLAKHGFEAVLLTGMTVRDQVRLFSSATHVVGAHGAGLANILFCNPGTRLLEFHMHDNLIWSIRRMAAVARLEYGCIFGSTDHPHMHLDERDWRVDSRELVQALPGFLER